MAKDSVSIGHENKERSSSNSTDTISTNTIYTESSSSSSSSSSPWETPKSPYEVVQDHLGWSMMENSNYSKIYDDSKFVGPAIFRGSGLHGYIQEFDSIRGNKDNLKQHADVFNKWFKNLVMDEYQDQIKAKLDKYHQAHPFASESELNKFVENEVKNLKVEIPKIDMDKYIADLEKIMKEKYVTKGNNWRYYDAAKEALDLQVKEHTSVSIGYDHKDKDANKKGTSETHDKEDASVTIGYDHKDKKVSEKGTPEIHDKPDYKMPSEDKPRESEPKHEESRTEYREAKPEPKKPEPNSKKNKSGITIGEKPKIKLKAPTVQKGDAIITIPFDHAGSSVTSKNKAAKVNKIQMDVLSEMLKNNDKIKGLETIGQTSASGSDSSNKKLSKDRVKNMSNGLKNSGIKQNITSQALGENFATSYYGEINRAGYVGVKGADAKFIAEFNTRVEKRYNEEKIPKEKRLYAVNYETATKQEPLFKEIEAQKSLANDKKAYRDHMKNRFKNDRDHTRSRKYSGEVTKNNQKYVELDKTNTNAQNGVATIKLDTFSENGTSLAKDGKLNAFDFSNTLKDNESREFGQNGILSITSNRDSQGNNTIDIDIKDDANVK